MWCLPPKANAQFVFRMEAYDVAGEVREAAIGATPAGRVPRGVYTVRGGTLRVVTAHRASPAQRHRYPSPAPEEDPDA